jgi:hypothetical protein
MNRGLFAQLVKDFCTLCGMEEPERILQGGPIAVDDIVFSLVYSESVNPDLVFIYCDFGELPRGRETEAGKALLEANLYLHTGGGPVFAISVETGRVVSADHRRLVDTKAEALRALLVKSADQAKQWRQHHFLNNNTSANASKPAAASPLARPGATPAAAGAARPSPFAKR